MKRHVTTHGNIDKTHICSRCGKGFAQKRYLSRHAQKCGAKKKLCPTMHTCEICGKDFDRPSHLHRHQLTHSSSSSEKFPCPLCGRDFTQKSHLKRHTFAKHRDAVPSSDKIVLFACLNCPDRIVRSFPSRWELRRHEGNVHATELSCQSCETVKNRSVTFETFTSWKSHVEYHQGRRPFLCNYCWEAFSKKTVLQFHVASKHQNCETFQCAVCEETFVQRTQIDRHIEKMHSSSKAEPLSCDYCNDRLTSESNLKTHLRIRHANLHIGTVHFCKYCSSWFLRNAELMEHYKKHFKRIDTDQQSTSNSLEETCDATTTDEENTECDSDSDLSESGSEAEVQELNLIVNVTKTDSPVELLKLSDKIPENIKKLYPQLEKLEILVPGLQSGEKLRVTVPVYSNEDYGPLMNGELEINYP